MTIDENLNRKLFGIASKLHLQSPIIISNKNNKPHVSNPFKVRFAKELGDTWLSGVTFDFKFNGINFEPLTKPINFRSDKYLKNLDIANQIYNDLLQELNTND